MNFSDRIVEMPASPIRRLMPYAQKAKDRGVEVLHVNIGQPDIKSPASLAEAMSYCNTDYIPYGPSAGLMEYREALARYYQGATGADIKPEHILVTTAGSEALLFSFLALCNPGDEIIVPEPFYANVAGFACQVGVKIVALPTYFDDNFALPNLAAVEKVISEKTRAIYICNPGNPTGAVYDRESLIAIAELAKKHDFFLIGDEVYREFVYNGVEHYSLLSLPGVEDRVIVADSVSKRYSLCGARIGCIVSRNIELLALILKLGQARLCPPTNEQKMLSYMVDHTSPEYFEEVLAEYARRRATVMEELDGIPGVRYSKPDGAFYMIAELPIANAEDFVIFLLEEVEKDGKTVMFAPASGFYKTEGSGLNQIRIAFVLEPEKLREAIAIMRVGLEKYLSLLKSSGRESMGYRC